MSSVKKITRFLGLAAITLSVLVGTTAVTRAQDKTTTTIRHGSPSYDTTVRNAEVVYVEGNDLVLKLEDGNIEHLVVPDEDKFTIDGRDVTVHELVPGTKLTQTITTTTTPRYVTSVRTLEGKVWHVHAPTSVVVTLPDGKNQIYQVPSHAKFIVNGEPKTVFDLKKGMNFRATIITDNPQTVMAQNKSVVGLAPPPATPRMVGVLLVLKPQAATPATETVASVDEPAQSLPQTASVLPTIGLLGALGVAASFGLGAARRAFNA